MILGYLHELSCDGEECRCERVYTVVRSQGNRAGEQAFDYTDSAGLRCESDTMRAVPASGLAPASGPFAVTEAKP